MHFRIGQEGGGCEASKAPPVKTRVKTQGGAALPVAESVGDCYTSVSNLLL